MEFKIKEGRIRYVKRDMCLHKNEKGFNELQLKALKRINRDRDSIFKTMRK